MSAKEREEVTPFLLFRDGYRCNPCGRSIDRLIEIRQREQQLTHREPYVTPVVIVGHKNGNSNQRDGDDGEYCGNLELQCYSCNRNERIRQEKIETSSIQTTREKQDALEGVPELINWTTANLIQNEEICFKELVMASRKSNKQSPVTNERNLGFQILTEFNKNGRFEIFPFNCGSRNCKNEHVCLAGHPPTKLIEAERKKLEADWIKDFGLSKEEYDKDPFGKLRVNWMTLDEYMQVNGKLINHNFSKTSGFIRAIHHPELDKYLHNN